LPGILENTQERFSEALDNTFANVEDCCFSEEEFDPEIDSLLSREVVEIVWW
jgi:hypothetical protein